MNATRGLKIQISQELIDDSMFAQRMINWAFATSTGNEFAARMLFKSKAFRFAYRHGVISRIVGDELCDNRYKTGIWFGLWERGWLDYDKKLENERYG